MELNEEIKASLLHQWQILENARLIMIGMSIDNNYYSVQDVENAIRALKASLSALGFDSLVKEEKHDD
jgi:hypothetical protein